MGVSERRSCRVLEVSLARFHGPGGTGAQRHPLDPAWTNLLRQLIQQHPTFGYRRLWVLLRFHEKRVLNRKAVYRVLKQKRASSCISDHQPRVSGAE
ncbi:MAG: IS3 family transposase, partial [Nitrospirota bacterium]|nr:IS3 family transposase [Nitrospirota bacterium]